MVRLRDGDNPHELKRALSELRRRLGREEVLSHYKRRFTKLSDPSVWSGGPRT